MKASFPAHWLSSKRILFITGLAMILVILLIWGCDWWVRKEAEKYCTSRLESLKEAPVALVLGCSPMLGTRRNLFFEYRIEAAAQLYKAGKVKALIVSGDNGSKDYDEPTMMKEALMAKGLPESVIYCDYAGFRTLDSVVRASSIFMQPRFIVVSQRFHNERAVFLARSHGLEATGFDARDVSRRIAPKTWLREYLARVQAVLDVTLFQTKPKFAGPTVKITQATK
jgi:SanA protein